MKDLRFQDIFLNELRRNGTVVRIELLNDTGLMCKIQGYDNDVVIVNTGNEHQRMLYKNNIISVAADKKIIQKQ